jgi:Fe-Mn family superoxide dismutase
MFVLPKLPYNMNALEPYIKEATVKFHYTKHHNGYVDKLNGLAKGTEFENASLEDVIKKAEGGVYNNAAQVWNHTFYWEGFSSNGGGAPVGELAKAIDSEFGSFEAFKEKFSQAAATLFGSGWAWLVVNKAGKLEIIQSSNAGNPLRDGYKPVLTCDVWEHAYYLDYQNVRPDYIKNYWELVDWTIINKRFINS